MQAEEEGLRAVNERLAPPHGLTSASSSNAPSLNDPRYEARKQTFIESQVLATVVKKIGASPTACLVVWACTHVCVQPRRTSSRRLSPTPSRSWRSRQGTDSCRYCRRPLMLETTASARHICVHHLSSLQSAVVGELAALQLASAGEPSSGDERLPRRRTAMSTWTWTTSTTTRTTMRMA